MGMHLNIQQKNKLIKATLFIMGIGFWVGCLNDNTKSGNPLGRSEPYAWYQNRGYQSVSEIQPDPDPLQLEKNEHDNQDASAIKVTPSPVQIVSSTTTTTSTTSTSTTTTLSISKLVPPKTTSTTTKITLPVDGTLKNATSPKNLPALAFESAVPFQAGEKMEFDISWSFIHGGTLSLSVDRGQVDQTEVWKFHAIAESAKGVSMFYHLRSSAISYVEADTFRAFRSESKSNESTRREDTWVFFDHTNGKVRELEKKYRQDKVKVKEYFTEVPPNVLDPMAFIFYARTLQFENGRKVAFPFYLNHRLREVRGQIETLERVKAPWGWEKAYRVSVHTFKRDRKTKQYSPDREFDMWFTADERRIPLKLDIDLPFGSFEMVLKKYQAGK